MIFGVSCGEYRRDGTMAEYVAVPERILHKLPIKVTFEEAALIEPLSIAVHAMFVSPLKMGDKAVIIGAGTIGLMLLQTVRQAGATQIIVLDLDEHKLELARKLGATETLSLKGEEAVETIWKLTDARGVDIAFEAVGVQPTFDTAVQAVRKGGCVVMVGNVSKTVQLPLQKCVMQEISLISSCASAGEYAVCLDMINAGCVQLGCLISKVAPLKEGGEWFDRLHAAEKGLIKVVLQP